MRVRNYLGRGEKKPDGDERIWLREDGGQQKAYCSRRGLIRQRGDDSGREVPEKATCRLQNNRMCDRRKFIAVPK